MRSSWRIGTAFGIGIYLHWSFFALPVLAFGQGYAQGGYQQGLFQFVLLLCLCVCVVLHELGHALMARVFGIATRDITLYPIGGVARLERMSTRPWEEILIAIAGPLVNVVLGSLIGVVGIALVVLDGPKGTYSQFFLALAFLNVSLVLFNLIPAFPMDGGRVFRAVLSFFIDYLRATEIAHIVGVGFAVCFGVISAMAIAFPRWIMLAPLGIIAVFLILAGKQELNAVRYRAALRDAEPIDAVPADSADPITPAAVGFSGYTWDADQHAYILWRNGRPVAAYPVPTE
jgi:Zn-dependent protease